MLAALLRVRQAYILSDRSRACRRINSCCCLLLPTAGPAVRVPAGCGGGCERGSRESQLGGAATSSTTGAGPVGA